MRTRLAAAVPLLLLANAAHAQTGAHPCAADAIARGKPLLMLHFEYKPGQTPQNLGVSDEVKVLPPIRALRGKGRLDVLEVTGHIYKAEYRMRFIYIQNKKPGDPCGLMGQEILGVADPY